MKRTGRRQAWSRTQWGAGSGSALAVGGFASGDAGRYRGGIVWAPVVFLIFATATAAFVAYGIHPAWGAFGFGLDLICTARRLQWPLLGASVVFSLALVGLVVSGKRRAWWLVGLGPIVALFAHRFATGATSQWRVLDDPPAISVVQAAGMADDEWVVATNIGDQPVAFPYAALYRAPVVVHDVQERRFVLIWSSTANRPVLLETERSLKATDLDLVSNPADGLILYNTRVGQFIYGFTGATPQGTVPTGVKRHWPARKMPWGQFRRMYPDGQVIVAAGGSGPGVPLLPYQRLPEPLRSSPRETGMLIESPTPVIVPHASMPTTPTNLSSADQHLLLIPPPVVSMVSVYERRVTEDLFPAFAFDPQTNPVAPLIDADTQTRWNLNGTGVVGPLKGERLPQLRVDDDLDLRLVRYWYPDAVMATVVPEPTIHRPDPPPAPKPARKRSQRGG